MSSNDLPQVNSTNSDDDQLNITHRDAGGMPTSGQPSQNIGVPSDAADSDLIEKEWVERAKQIVEHTKDDPHEQQKALSRMKADYMKKRYNKDIKVSNE